MLITTATVATRRLNIPIRSPSDTMCTSLLPGGKKDTLRNRKVTAYRLRSALPEKIIAQSDINCNKNYNLFSPANPLLVRPSGQTAG